MRTRRRAPRAASKHRALPTRRTWRSRAQLLPSIVGVVALVATGGATAASASAPSTAPAPQAHDHPHHAHGTDAGLIVGAETLSFAADERELAISRDSQRQALSDAADARLQAAANQQFAERNAALKQLGQAAEKRAAEIAKNAWKLPTQNYRLTARFGQAGGLWSSDHTGLDFAAPEGTPIFAVANGKITDTGTAGAYGNRTVQTLPDGTEIWYCHQSSIGVNPGENVVAGAQIGEIGSTGNVTGPHLHLEVRPGGGDPVDPFAALKFHGIEP